MKRTYVIIEKHELAEFIKDIYDEQKEDNKFREDCESWLY